MSIYKFRAWDKTTNHMHYLSNSHDALIPKFFDNSLEYMNFQHGEGGTDYELMQFIWRIDIHGKEIYEGDIVEYDNPNAGYGCTRHRTII